MPALPEDWMPSRLATLIVVAIVAVTTLVAFIVGAQRYDLSGPMDLPPTGVPGTARIRTAGSQARSRQNRRQR